jgi:hypothetical protein
MNFIQFLAMFGIITTLALVVVYVLQLRRKAVSESSKKFISRYFSFLIITFIAGGVTRIIQQSTGFEWQNGFVTLFGGMYCSLLGVPFLWRTFQNNLNGLKRILFLIPGLLFTLSGFGIIYLGITQVWTSIR